MRFEQTLVILFCFLPTSANVRWDPEWKLSKSTWFMPCNYSGWFDLDYASKFGLIDFDWSNAKQLWANSKPMDCEERMLNQVKRLKQVNPEAHFMIYRNLVKALPWFTSIRKKIENPAYSNWFLPFKNGTHGKYHVPVCDEIGKCSVLYHDQVDTPGTTHSKYDGICDGECDCGNIPCGEYIFDHRNKSLQDFLIKEYIFSDTGLGNELIDGCYLDDVWYDTSAPGDHSCHGDRFGGPSEMNANCTLDIGLSKKNVQDITSAWRETLESTLNAMKAASKITFALITSTSTPENENQCKTFFQNACRADSAYLSRLLLFQFNITRDNPATYVTLNHPVTDVAAFLLIRGPNAYIGHGWIGCVDSNVTAATLYPRPSIVEKDIGLPIDTHCIAVGDGTYTRKYAKAVASFNCNSMTGDVAFSVS